MGRPAKPSEELGQRICARIMNGESVRAICADDGMPSRSTFFNWLADEDNEWFRRAYMLAKDAQADVLADEILDIADDASNDWMRRNGGNEEEWQLNHDHGCKLTPGNGWPRSSNRRSTATGSRWSTVGGNRDDQGNYGIQW